jgi:dethiobiotin synthetase
MSSPVFVVVSGTDTGVGKTVFTSACIRWLRSRNIPSIALKPLASGDRTDAEALHRAQDGDVPLDVINPWHFPEPLTPLLAARRAGRRVAPEAVLSHIRAAGRGMRVVLVEAAGGWLSPLMEGMDAPGLVSALGARVVLVAANRLGVISQLRLACDSISKTTTPSQRKRPVSSPGPVVVLMDPPIHGLASETNVALLREFLPPERIVSFPWLRGPSLRKQGHGIADASLLAAADALGIKG